MSPLDLEYSVLLSVLYGVSIYATAFFAASLFGSVLPISNSVPVVSTRFGAIDGLRGVLAIGVFVHHSFASFEYFRTGRWDWSSNPILNGLGEITVAMFFMITGFLFSIKATNDRINWRTLYISRIFRLWPLYAVIVFLVVFVTLVASDGLILVTPWKLFKEIIQWFFFAGLGRPDINGFPMTWTLIAGVNWSLKYEVAFYCFGVPAIYFLHKKLCGLVSIIVVFGILFGVLFYRHKYESAQSASLYAAHFLCGIMTALISKDKYLRNILQSIIIRVLAVIALIGFGFVIRFHSVFSVISTWMVFSAVVGGASIWGLLYSRPAVWLGEVSYSVYLLHGILLWGALKLLTYGGALESIGLIQYWGLVLFIGVVLILMSWLSFLFIEKPMINLGARLAMGVERTRLTA